MNSTLRRLLVLTTFLMTVSVNFSAPAHADEKIEKPAYWLARGYHAVGPGLFKSGLEKKSLSVASETPAWAPHSLAWPVLFQDAEHSIGNSMLEFQSYGDGPYYHGGCDLRVAAGAAVHTPVAGRIEAGHYGYSNLPNGSMQKFWYAWPQSGDTTYFEVAIITEDGYRFEFHHMDETRIAPEVLQILQAGQGGQVAAGTLLGNTIPWPDGDYHHTHYNILTPSLVQLNPEYYSPLLEDHEKPQVSSVLASFAGGRTEDFGAGHFAEAPEFFALAVIDHLNGDIYDHPPVYASVQFASGPSYVWDFRERLLGPDGKFPNLWSFFVESIATPGGQTLATEGGYGQGISVVRVPVPTGAQGKFTLQVGDQADNRTVYLGSVGP